MKTIIKQWIPLAVVITLFCGLLYGAVQQAYRQGANDPQIQLAEDAARILSTKGLATVLVPQDPVDIAQTLAPFIIVYDSTGKPTQSSGLLNSSIPTPTSGVFDYVRTHGEERVTWEPERGVRIAAVIVRASAVNATGADTAFVLAGRSLTEVEKRERSLEFQVGFAWIVTLAISFGSIYVLRRPEQSL